MSGENASGTPRGSGDYEVGYGRPPAHTRFRKGQSGNPKGRPRGTKNLKTDLMEELGERILVREGERAQRVSKQRAVVKTLMNRTLKGDPRAASLLLSMMMRLIDTGEAGSDIEAPLEEDELDILDTFAHRLRQGEGEAGTGTPRGTGNQEERS